MFKRSSRLNEDSRAKQSPDPFDRVFQASYKAAMVKERIDDGALDRMKQQLNEVKSMPEPKPVQKRVRPGNKLVWAAAIGLLLLILLPGGLIWQQLMSHRAMTGNDAAWPGGRLEMETGEAEEWGDLITEGLGADKQDDMNLPAIVGDIDARADGDGVEIKLKLSTDRGTEATTLELRNQLRIDVHVGDTWTAVADERGQERYRLTDVLETSSKPWLETTEDSLLLELPISLMFRLDLKLVDGQAYRLVLETEDEVLVFPFIYTDR